MPHFKRCSQPGKDTTPCLFINEMKQGNVQRRMCSAFQLYYTILYYTILYSTLLYSTLLYSTVLYYTILYYTILYYTILYYTILYYTILYYTLLHYTTLFTKLSMLAQVLSCSSPMVGLLQLHSLGGGERCCEVPRRVLRDVARCQGSERPISNIEAIWVPTSF